MNTFTFTDDEIKALKLSIALATARLCLQDESFISTLSDILRKLERKQIIVGYTDEDGNATIQSKEK